MSGGGHEAQDDISNREVRHLSIVSTLQKPFWINSKHKNEI